MIKKNLYKLYWRNKWAGRINKERINLNKMPKVKEYIKLETEYLNVRDTLTTKEEKLWVNKLDDAWNKLTKEEIKEIGNRLGRK